MLFKIIGIIGMLFIIGGVIIDKDKDIERCILSFIGSVFLFAYSLSLKDPIFTPLQVIFGGVNLYEIWKLKRAAKITH